MSARQEAGACAAVVAAMLLWAPAAGAAGVGAGTFQTPLGPVDWRWSVSIKRHDRHEVRITQRLWHDAVFESLPDTTKEEDDVPTFHRLLLFQTRETPAPVVFHDMYPLSTNPLVSHPVHLAGIVTLANVRALRLHYVYTAFKPVGPGTQDQVIASPVSRHTLRGNPLKFWFAGANGGPSGFVYDLQTVEGKVRVCRRHTCRLYWKLISKWPPWSKIARLGRLLPAT